MNKLNKKLIMFVGKTHSGKTTLAKELEKKNKSIIILEADPIALFMRDNFPKLRDYDDKHHESSFKNISLKYKTFLLFVEFAMSLEKSIILSNSNMWKNGRKFIFKLCKKYNYKTICVYFDLPESTLIKRAENSKRDAGVLRRSKNFNELILNQRTRMETPNSKDFDKFFVIKSQNELKKIKEKIIKILK